MSLPENDTLTIEEFRRVRGGHPSNDPPPASSEPPPAPSSATTPGTCAECGDPLPEGRTRFCSKDHSRRFYRREAAGRRGPAPVPGAGAGDPVPGAAAAPPSPSPSSSPLVELVAGLLAAGVDVEVSLGDAIVFVSAR